MDQKFEFIDQWYDEELKIWIQATYYEKNNRFYLKYDFSDGTGKKPRRISENTFVDAFLLHIAPDI